jgi:hypothetical protein
VKAAALVLSVAASFGAWAADTALLRFPAFRNGWASLALWIVPIGLALAGSSAEGRRKLKAAAWVLAVASLGGWIAMRVGYGTFQGKPALAAGDLAPDFVLKDPDGKDVRLSDIADRERVLLVFFRGTW